MLFNFLDRLSRSSQIHSRAVQGQQTHSTSQCQRAKGAGDVGHELCYLFELEQRVGRTHREIQGKRAHSRRECQIGGLGSAKKKERLIEIIQIWIWNIILIDFVVFDTFRTLFVIVLLEILNKFLFFNFSLFFFFGISLVINHEYYLFSYLKRLKPRF